ncbi:hypothetical protein MGYG_09098 [Nannizzia gypsea CBS 118893]|uniref:Phosphoribosyltransferase domain-containing protein n=1 Tax=Arthroderma gypseum (strain ATCC MYA-4604 / CBS 118893) TaxID=535722 RepID=E4UXW1_ARTGP|nr:hypothetical protein MGYG_09098 [Nannizzia gypsea CBS 118893]EFR02793.1 hypothetical protein MGYG_09098 [Nannizzia gypsea CBS 118893]
MQPLSKKKPVIIGLYGVSGVGKTTLLNQLKQILKEEHFLLYEGSQSKKAAIVTGYFSFFDGQDGEAALPIITSDDLDTYTHILYLDVPPEVLLERHTRDYNRVRSLISIENLHIWQEMEISQLRPLWLQHGILFMRMTPEPELQRRVSNLLCDLRIYNKEINLECAKARMEAMITKPPLTMLVLDADKTLSEKDTGVLFWEKDKYHMDVWAFGDSPLDMEMLKRADKGIVVVGAEATRSKSMDSALIEAIESDGARLQQLVLPRTTPIWLDSKRLPPLDITGAGFVDFVPFPSPPSIQLIHATEKSAARLLMTGMRNASVVGLDLCRAHKFVGKYLATELLSDIIGVEEYSIPHVLGYETSGHQLYHEGQTLIMAVMRAGEPMACGVWDTFPKAAFLHVKFPEDVKPHHVEGKVTIILVDSVINSGKTVAEFLERIQKLHSTAGIVVVAGVVQAECISSQTLTHKLRHGAKVSVVALRISQNRYTGRGTTDTGNRLFNTTSLP